MTGRKSIFTARQDAVILRMKDEGFSHATIAARFCVPPKSVTHRLKVLRARERFRKPQPEPKAVPAVQGAHLEGYHRARRGFHVPPGKRDAYFALLKTGTPIAVAARKLGLSAGEGA